MKSVYIASAGERRHKIGISGNPRRRVRALAGASGYVLSLAETREAPNAEAVERMTHWLLRASRLHGEWFAVDVATAQAAVAEAVARIAAGELPPRRTLGDEAGRGRPPLGNKATQVRLPQEVMERIDALMGQNRRAKFIREAVEAELDRREGAAKRNG